jgi:lipopolysaccharide transport system ATP-binding protein
VAAPPILTVEGLSKVYRKYARPADRLVEMIFRTQESEPIVALQPISFKVGRGEAVGIVGRNGSGKSTLLKLIAGVLTPTTGSVTARGRISALLELGGGFNPEFTGRENVFFYGAMLGVDRKHLERLYDGIVHFADIGLFIDEPVRTYSSGMFVRLAFAVAISVEPDILIVDEALAVGDVYFQQKCFDRIRELRERGTTLLLVSHDSGAIYRFCDRGILLDAGAVVLDGDPRSVIELYEAYLIRERDAAARQTPPLPLPESAATPTAETSNRIESDDVELRQVELLSPDGVALRTVVCGERRTLRVTLIFAHAQRDPHVGFKIRDRLGSVVYEANSFTLRAPIGPVLAGEAITVDFGLTLPVSEGEYTVTIGIAEGGVGEASFKRQLFYAHELLDFRVLRDPAAGIWSGFVNLDAQVSVQRPNTART